MTLQQLVYFITLAKKLHYTKAAQQLFVSQPSLSRSISDLEKELGAPLFEKDGKNTTLTKYGAAFLPYAKKTISSIEAGKNAISKMLLPSETIHMGYIYSLSFSILPQIMEGFLADHGEYQFSFFQGMSTDIADKLKKGELDIALSLDPEDEAIHAIPIFRQPLYLVVPEKHPLTSREQVQLEDLENESFVSIQIGSNLRRKLDDIFKTLRTTPHISFEAEECNAMASFVSAGMGVAIMPEIPSLRSYRVAVIPIENNLLSRKIYALYATDREMPPGAQKLLDYLTSNYAL